MSASVAGGISSRVGPEPLRIRGGNPGRQISNVVGQAAKRANRWVVVAAVFVVYLVLAPLTLEEAAKPPALGIKVERVGDRLVIREVQPAGIGWDAGLRAGQTIVAVNDQPATDQTPAARAVAATALDVVDPDGQPHSANVDALTSSIAFGHQLNFLIIAGCFVLVGGTVYVLAADALASAVVLLWALASATMLGASVASLSQSALASSITRLAVIWFGASTFLLFLVFPRNRLRTSWGRRVAVVAGGVASAFSLAYLAILFAEPEAFGAYRAATLGVVAIYLLGATTLGATSFRLVSGRRQVRQALGLVALSTVVGLAPVCFLAFGPLLIGGAYLVRPEVAILSIVLLPISIGTAVLSREFFGIERVLRRGLVALLVWFGLLALYSAFFEAASRLEVSALPTAAALRSTVFQVALTAGTFPLIQRYLRGVLERLVFRDVYSYSQTLQDVSTEVVYLDAREDIIANHVLRRIGETIGLSWAAVALAGDGQPLLYRWGACPETVTAGALIEVGEKGDHHFAPPEPARSVGEGDRSPRHGGNVVAAATVLPLIADGAVVGALACGSKQHDVELLADDLALLHTLAPLFSVSFKNAGLVRSLEAQVVALEEREQALSALSIQLMRVQEEERYRLALDVHDDPLQRAILLTREFGDSGPVPSMMRYRDAMQEITESLRAICAGLRPRILDDFGLEAALEGLINDVRARSDVLVSLQLVTPDGAEFGRLPGELEISLYRVTQEAVNNCLKHANATELTVKLMRDGQEVALCIGDNGQGIAPLEAGQRAFNLGALGMRERLRPWSGTIEVDSGAGRGTVVTAKVPMAVAAAAPAGGDVFSAALTGTAVSIDG